MHFWVKDLTRWTEGFRKSERLVWLRIEGLPFHIWREEVFSNIASSWGKVITFRNCNLVSYGNLMWGKVLISTCLVERILEIKCVKVNNLAYVIKVEEEDGSALERQIHQFEEDSKDVEEISKEDSSTPSECGKAIGIGAGVANGETHHSGTLSPESENQKPESNYQQPEKQEVEESLEKEQTGSLMGSIPINRGVISNVGLCLEKERPRRASNLDFGIGPSSVEMPSGNIGFGPDLETDKACEKDNSYARQNSQQGEEERNTDHSVGKSLSNSKGEDRKKFKRRSEEELRMKKGRVSFHLFKQLARTKQKGIKAKKGSKSGKNSKSGRILKAEVKSKLAGCDSSSVNQISISSDLNQMYPLEGLKEFGNEIGVSWEDLGGAAAKQKRVRRAWASEVKSSRPDCIFRDKLKKVKESLKVWKKTNWGEIDKEVIIAKEEVKSWEARTGATSILKEEDRLRWLSARRKWLELEEKNLDLLKQKAKLKWIKDGDENSKLFHIASKLRERKNCIHRLNIEGKWVDEPETIKKHISQFFRKKFGKEVGNRPTLNMLGLNKLNAEEASSLEGRFTEEEVWNAVRDCGRDKSPGPDGFSMEFIKHFWDLLKKELMVLLDWFWEKAEFGRGCNASFLTLIPKVANPIGLNDFRPISLIGITYKIITKVLAERLKRVIGSVISDVQSAFIIGRSILDGILIANETVSFLKNSKRKGMIFKVDFEKAYDTVDWSFLLEGLKNMGFGEKWRKWIKGCLQSSRISVLVNGSQTDEFPMERGLRQGDPLAPFLFLIVSECLHLMIKKAEEKGLFKGTKVGKDGVIISHLQYADDVINFGEWEAGNFLNLLKILECFHLGSGLKINLQKSKLYGVGVKLDEVQSWASRLGCGSANLPFIYLGLPVGGSMQKYNAWQPVIEKTKCKLGKWKAKMISFGGRWTLRKEGSIEEMSRSWDLEWRREPRGREIGELEELHNLISGIHLKKEKMDRLLWRLDPLNGFSVKALRGLIDEARGRGNEGNRFGFHLCPRCGCEEETVDHALVNCSKVKILWKSVGKWWNMDCDGCRTLEEIWDLGNHQGSNNKGTERWLATSWCFLYKIWAERNRLVFKQSSSELDNRFLTFQRSSFEWITRRDKALAMDWKSWLTDPFGA
ncbi:hypothetical protein OSB04_031357 [Centaurea solstitialis]|uniref:Reverse transcriptase domain-containing protein n=1 Tax=Centaurea solstitialis TaxID=347529 RepID=A0AA38W5X1_9ASTR|nr:hypothetical protein OSB04_031357 [Centaurea solstitialis]